MYRANRSEKGCKTDAAYKAHYFADLIICVYVLHRSGILQWIGLHAYEQQHRTLDIW